MDLKYGYSKVNFHWCIFHLACGHHCHSSGVQDSRRLAVWWQVCPPMPAVTCACQVASTFVLDLKQWQCPGRPPGDIERGPQRHGQCHCAIRGSFTVLGFVPATCQTCQLHCPLKQRSPSVLAFWFDISFNIVNANNIIYSNSLHWRSQSYVAYIDHKHRLWALPCLWARKIVIVTQWTWWIYYY